MRAASPRCQLERRPHRLHRARDVPAPDAEAVRTDPFERLLLPFEGDAELREPQAAARASADSPPLDRRDSGIAGEAVRVRDKRPEAVGARLEVELGAIDEL